MSQHTPGEWIIHPENPTPDHSALIYAFDKCVGQDGRSWGQGNRVTIQLHGQKSCGTLPGEIQADARLIAAAPDLLTALKDLIEGNQLLPGYHYDQVRAAIKRAEGGSR